ncbi:MAG: signal recognition particle-docking protein FtsY [Candidatus Jettenia sp.]|nr:MAG: signal recognition particle-docking protein FtsY [Candidatus Jettenia sp. AMX1]MBC6927420.1 signal recognition particle-docking protein FtsY [Candidatus Jettenia sp.]MCE7879104.1 signal recognition particle-docking protein FtsY [Candidatus Jettenia sp. AMX1]MCQ3925850.1 signal recognition particle-docking protein FtsY [Candidatus Jettenia sp.]MDL1937511.1 signal recognition particle-docking protein FtsY [Candidatus Jettenia sp. AMX1]
MIETQKIKTGLKKKRVSFWYRLKNFTVESRKTVIIENGVVRLVPIEPEVSVIEEETALIEIDTEESPISPDTPDTQGAIKKPVSALSETAVIEVDTEEIISTPTETTVIETEEQVSVLPETAVTEDDAEKQALASSETAVMEEEVETPIPSLQETAVIEDRIKSEKLKKGLEKTRNRFWSRLKGVFSFRRTIDESVLEELEDILIGADIGVKPVQRLMQEIHEAWKSKTINETTQIHDFIKSRLKEDLQSWQIDINYAPTPPTVIMVVGVNGVGKTTSIAKLASLFIKEGKRVMVAAGDTFRAAAADQLDIWSKRIGADIVKHQTGSDPAAVTYDALEASISRGIDILIVDTAGRLHTHENLMNELSKIKRVISKRSPGAPHEVLMVLDATTGQNAISQAKMFKQAVDITGIFLAKIDGTAKGGVVLGMRNEINIPVKFIGLGEKADDIEKFNPDAFVNALFEQ